MADSASAGEKMTFEENRGGDNTPGSEDGGLQHVYFFIPPPTITVTPATPSAVETPEAVPGIQVSDVESTHPSITTKPAGEEEPTIKVETDVEVESKAEKEPVIVHVNDDGNTHLTEGETVSRAKGSPEHVYTSSPSPVIKGGEDSTSTNKHEITSSNSTLPVFDIPTIIITAASATPSRATSKAGTDEDEDGEEEEPDSASASASASTSEVEAEADAEAEAEAEVENKDEDEETTATPAEQEEIEAGNNNTSPENNDNDHVGKKLKTDIDSSVNVATETKPGQHQHQHQHQHHTKKNTHGKRHFHSRTPSSPNTAAAYKTPSGQTLTKQELYALKHGVENERGDTVYFKPSFIEDPWVAAEQRKVRREEWAKEQERGREFGVRAGIVVVDATAAAAATATAAAEEEEEQDEVDDGQSVEDDEEEEMLAGEEELATITTTTPAADVQGEGNW